MPPEIWAGACRRVRSPTSSSLIFTLTSMIRSRSVLEERDVLSKRHRLEQGPDWKRIPNSSDLVELLLVQLVDLMPQEGDRAFGRG